MSKYHIKFPFQNEVLYLPDSLNDLITEMNVARNLFRTADAMFDENLMDVMTADKIFDNFLKIRASFFSACGDLDIHPPNFRSIKWILCQNDKELFQNITFK
jgi:hypothetical protein